MTVHPHIKIKRSERKPVRKLEQGTQAHRIKQTMTPIHYLSHSKKALKKKKNGPENILNLNSQFHILVNMIYTETCYLFLLCKIAAYY